VRKVVWDEMSGKSGEKVDCFLLSGSKVLEGVGTYVVTGVGQNSFHGKIMMCKSLPSARVEVRLMDVVALRGDAETTPLQLKLNALAELIAKLGSAAGLILFSCLMIRFFVQLVQNADR
jgi:Ca2+-transporting ATPase